MTYPHEPILSMINQRFAIFISPSIRIALNVLCLVFLCERFGVAVMWRYYVSFFCIDLSVYQQLQNHRAGLLSAALTTKNDVNGLGLPKGFRRPRVFLGVTSGRKIPNLPPANRRYMLSDYWGRNSNGCNLIKVGSIVASWLWMICCRRWPSFQFNFILPVLLLSLH